jgi:carbamate kinase
MTPGNGPQVGFLAIEAEMAADVVPAPPLDVLGAESQGQIGYLMGLPPFSIPSEVREG